MSVFIKDILGIVEKQNQWRGQQTLNLIASENVQSPAVRQIEANDFMSRYAEGHPNTTESRNRYYEGTCYIDQIESMATQEFCSLAQATHADVRPISGNAANTAVALSLLRGGDSVIANSIDAGGHISHNPIGVFGRRIQMRGQVLASHKENSVALSFWPVTEDGYHLDVEKGLDLLDRVRPNLVILGKSLFLFPEPVTPIAAACKTLGIPMLYDAAHVLGLILGGQFQNPLEEGAHLMTASTHKTFPGPQRGVILGRLHSDAEQKWWTAIDRGVMPGSSSNHHLHTLPGLLVTLREMQQYGKDYATQTVRNAQALGQALTDEGVAVEARAFGFTQSHQIAVNVSHYGPGPQISQKLAENNIITNYNMLPGDLDPKNPTGIRIGVQELTRYGMKVSEMGEVATLIKEVLKGKTVTSQVQALKQRFNTVHYC